MEGGRAGGKTLQEGGYKVGYGEATRREVLGRTTGGGWVWEAGGRSSRKV